MRLHHISFICLISCNVESDNKVGVYNTPPAVTFISPADDSFFNEGEVIEIVAKVNDDFDAPDELQLTWTSDLQGDLTGGGIPDTEGVVQLATANLEPGVHVISLLVVDSRGDSDAANLKLTVNDLAENPEIIMVHPDPTELGEEGVPFEFMAEVFDPQEEEETLWVSFYSGPDPQSLTEFCSPIADNAGIASCEAILEPGSHYLEFTVINASGYEASVTGGFTVMAAVDIDHDGDNFTENQFDCDDSDPSIYPGAAEVQNAIDDDCDGEIDEGTVAYDDDGDCYCETGPCMGSINLNCTVLTTGDCNDLDANINPGVTEICSDSVDNNCNGLQNEENAQGCITYFRDDDSDGFGQMDSVCACSPGGPDGSYTADNADDCYDDNNQVHPNQTAFFVIDRGDGLFDYDCDNQEQQALTSMGDCAGWSPNLNDACILNYQGWADGIPACGDTGDWLEDNDSCSSNWFSCNESPETNVQTCR